MPLLVLVLALVGARPAAAEQGVTDAEIVVGCSTDLSGPLAFTGEQSTRFGVDLYFKGVNEQGGIHGRKVRTVYHDDGSRPPDALANARTLVEQDGVFAVIAPLGAAPVAATLGYLQEHAVPLLFPLQGSPAIRGRKDVLGGTALYDRQSRMMIDYLAGPRKYRKFAAVYQDDEYGRSFVGFLRKDLARHRLSLVAAEPLVWGTPDVSAPLTRLRADRPEVLLMVLTPGPAAEVITGRQKIGWKDVLLVSTGPLTDERYLVLAGPAAEGVEGLALWPDPVTSDRPGVQAYRDALKKYAPSNPPNRASLSGYFAAMLFTEGARRAGRALTRDGLMAGLLSIKDLATGILPPITIGRDHETQRQGFWVKMEHGRLSRQSDWLRSE